jgi:hypothetical protein
MTAGTTMLMFQAIAMGRPAPDAPSRSRSRRLDLQDRPRRRVRDNRDEDIRGLDPEEDGWLIDQIIRERPRRRQEAAFAAWAQAQIDNTEGRP